MIRAWHSIEFERVFDLLKTRPEGLAQEEAGHRLSEYGLNSLRPPKRRGPLMRFLAQFNNVLLYVLLVSAAVTAVIGHHVDSGVIFGVVLINAVIGFLQEGKAEKAMEAIRGMLSHQAFVLRGGRRVMVPAESLVPGDIVLLQSGDRVPADLRLFRVKNLRVEEAVLTGESVPVEKSAGPVHESAAVADRSCMAFSGTFVVFGQSEGVVVATGDKTEIGRISELLGEVRQTETKLLTQMSTFGRHITLAIFALAIATFAFGVLVRDYPVREMFLAGVGLAVAAIPEGLPAIITITLAIGVQRMAKRNAIIRRLPAVETLGSVTVICTDKTGTLTHNEMMVQAVAADGRLFNVTGEGYGPRGGILEEGAEVACEDYPGVMELARAGLLCNDSTVEEDGALWRMHGDPTEGALVTFAMKAGLQPSLEKERFPRADVIPFESEHRFMATLNHDHAGHGFIYVKGAPERVLEMCGWERLHGENRSLAINYWHDCIGRMAEKGQRILAVAFKAAAESQRELRFADVEGGLTLLGLCGIIDAPRADAVKAIAQCGSAGIQVKMITGDHALTARAIGAQMGIGDGKAALTGPEIDILDDKQLRLAVREIGVFARVSPENKLRLVKALQANGEIVAMTGDGVNDAPALKRADVGVAMGIKGTEVAKEAAEMVLADDNFASIAHAVEEGRTVYDNLRKAVILILPTNAGEAGVIVSAVIFGGILPITPVQILWVNMVTAVTLALALAFEPAEADIMLRHPRDPRESILSSFMWWRLIFISLILVVGTYGLFLWERFHGAPLEAARTVAVNALVIFEIFYLFNSRYIYAPAYTKDGLLGNRYALIAVGSVTLLQVLFTYLPFMQHLFGTTSIRAYDWVRIVLFGFSLFVLVEMEKALLRRRVEIQANRLNSNIDKRG